MSNYGVTKDGFKRKPYTAILEEMQGRAKVLFGEGINLSEKNPLGKFIQLIAWRESELWEVAEKVYYSAYVDDAEGRQLDGVIKYIAMERKGEFNARGTIVAIGDEGTKIDTDLIIETKDKVAFSPIKNYVIGPTPTEIEVVCLQEGTVGNVPANSITEIVTPIAGLESITNSEPITNGRDIEQDPEVKERYYRSLSRGGNSTREAVEAALLDMDSVKDAFVEENDTIEVTNGIPPKCLAPFIFGGDDTEIAKTILSSKASGIRSYGTTEVEVEDSKGYKHIIGFTRPVSKDIYIRVVITKNSHYQAGGDKLIRTAIIKYIGGIDEDGSQYKGLGLGQDVVISRIMALSNMPGIEDISIELSSDGVFYSATNIELSKMEIASTEYSKVTIT